MQISLQIKSGPETANNNGNSQVMIYRDIICTNVSLQRAYVIHSSNTTFCV